MKHNREQVNQCYTHELVMLDTKREQEKNSKQPHTKMKKVITIIKKEFQEGFFALKILVVGCDLLCK